MDHLQNQTRLQNKQKASSRWFETSILRYSSPDSRQEEYPFTLGDVISLLQAVINDVTQKKAKLLHLLAKAENIRTSRDELTDMLAANSLPENLKSIWDTKGAEQLGIVRLNKAASRGEVEELQVITSFSCGTFHLVSR